MVTATSFDCFLSLILSPLSLLVLFPLLLLNSFVLCTDIDYTRDFILTYRYFITSEKLLEMLIIRYKFEPPPDANADTVAYWDKWRAPVRLRYVGEETGRREKTEAIREDCRGERKMEAEEGKRV